MVQQQVRSIYEILHEPKKNKLEKKPVERQAKQLTQGVYLLKAGAKIESKGPFPPTKQSDYQNVCSGSPFDLAPVPT